jgi:hypothetical protein
MRRTVSIAVALMLALAAPGAAFAQSLLDQLKKQQADLLGKMEINLSVLDVNKKQMEQLDKRKEGLNGRIVETNAERERANSYCTFTLPEPAYSQRVAECNSWQSQIDTKQRDIKTEFEGVDRIVSDLETSDQKRAQEFGGLMTAFGEALTKMGDVCMTLSIKEQIARCNMPPPAGPFTSQLLQELQQAQSEQIAECAGLSKDRQKECLNQLFDGNEYHPNRPELPDPPG